MKAIGRDFAVGEFRQIDRRHQRGGERRQRGVDQEGEQDHALDRNAEDARDVRVLRGRLHLPAGAACVVGRAAARRRRRPRWPTHDQALHARHGAEDRDIGGGGERRERLRLGAVEVLHGFLQEQRQRHGGDRERQHAVAQHRIDQQLLEQHAEHDRRDHDADGDRAQNGTPSTLIAISMKNAGSMTNSPWAKLMVCEVCHSSVKPIATSA